MAKKQTQEEVLADFRSIHGDRYDYSEVIYVKSKDKVKIKCLVDGHGIFPMSSIKHKLGGNCHKCARIEGAKKAADSKRASLSSVLSNFRRIHGNEYDYSKVEYVNNKEEVEIICSKHFSFPMTPLNHVNGQKCPKCRGKNLTTADYKEIIIEKFGDIYDLNALEYTGYNNKFTLKCKTHGEFDRYPRYLMEGNGCPDCIKARENKTSKKRILKNSRFFLPVDIFNQFNKIHNFKYTYDKSYIHNLTRKILIYCPIHKYYFPQSAGNHLRGQSCPKCKGRQLTTEDQIIEFKLKHGNLYDYSKVIYEHNEIPVEIICNKEDHGSFFQEVYIHKNGAHCPQCIGNINLTNTEYIDKCIATHGDRYDYSETKYIRSIDRVTVICKKHGPWKPVAYFHGYGKGCPDCAGHGFNKNKKGILYYIRINKDGREVYKIGITNRSVKKRFDEEFKYITIIRQYEYDSGGEAYDMEQQILKDYSYAKYTGDKILKSGNTEMFKYDILGWDN